MKILKIALFASIFLLSTISYAADQGATKYIDTSTGSTLNTPTPEQDAIITKKINQLIRGSKTLSKLKVNVSSNEGRVKITGTVDSDSQASALVSRAESVVGVVDVDTSDLKIKKGSQPFTDMMITAKIKGLFIREKLFGEKDIAAINTSVETKDGVVYLTGTVDNQDQINNAIEIIQKNIPGIKKVEYNLKKVETLSKK